MKRSLPGALLALLAVLALGTTAPASGHPSTSSLQIAEEDSWHPDREMHFEWQPLPPPGQPFLGRYRIYGSDGKTVREETRPLSGLLHPIPVPPQPGIYTLEAWLQNEAGEQGPHSTATFRFDDAVPSSPALQPPPGWVLDLDPVRLTVGSGTGAPPLSGIRGYAVSVDRGDGSSPCASPTRCGAAEIDLAKPGSISLGLLPEGVNFVRVVAVSGSGLASPPQTAEVRVDGTPPLVSLRGVSSGWSAGPVQLTALAEDDLSGMAAAGPLGPFTAIAVDGGAAARAPGDRVETTITGSGLHQVEYFAGDAAGNVSGGGAGLPKPKLATVRIDEAPPTVVFAAAQDPADPEQVEASVGDALSGPSLDRGGIEVRPVTGGRFEQLPTRVLGDRLVARWDSDSYPPGRYEFRATGFDAAGNTATGANRARGGRMVLVNPLKLPVSLEAGFAGKRLGTVGQRWARYGRGVGFGGQLKTAAGTPAAGLEVAVTEILVAGSEPERRTTFARTGPDGRFRIRLAPGPSREVVATFAGNRLFTRASSKRVELAVPTSLRLRASAASARVGGAPVVFSGRIAQAGVEAGTVARLPVELQFRFRGDKWSEFRTVETDARGRFRYAYRFSDDDSRGVRFQFRAYIKGREGWPYEPGASRPVLVTGR